MMMSSQYTNVAASAHVLLNSHVSINNSGMTKIHINGSLLTCLVHSNVLTIAYMN